MNYFTLMSYILTWAPKGPIDESDRAWMRLLDEAIDGVSPVHNQILSTLTLLSNSLLSGQSLPPYLPLPQPYEMIHHLLSISARQQPGGAAAASGDPTSQSLFSVPSAASGPSHGLLRQETRRATGIRDGGGSRNNETQAPGSGAGSEPEPEPEAWNLLDARNMEQQGYTEFAVLQVCSTLIISELRGLIETVADLVGTVDFSFRVDRGGPSDTSLESVRRMGTWASRAVSAAAAGGKGKGKND